MQVDLGDAVAGVGVAVSVIDDHLAELGRLGALPQEVQLQRMFGSVPVVATVLIDTPRFQLARPPGAEPHTRLHLTGTIEVRRADADPASPPLTTLPLDAKVKLALVLVPDAADPAMGDPPSPVLVVGFEYQGTEEPPLAPVTAADIDDVFRSEAIAKLLAGIRIDLAGPLIVGLNESVFPDEGLRPAASSWALELHLLPGAPGVGAGAGAEAATVDAFACVVGLPGMSATPPLRESWVAERTGLGLVCGRRFLDAMLEQGAAAKRGTTIDGAEISDLTLVMADDAIAVEGAGVRRVTVFPDVDFTFAGPMVPSLVRGTTGMAFDATGVEVEVDDSDEVFYAVFKWVVTVFAIVLFSTGFGLPVLASIAIWATVVPRAWDGDADIDAAPNTLRNGLATALGASLAKLAEALDDDTDQGPLRLDATPDSLVVVNGSMVFLAQLLVVPIAGRMRSAEYSRSLRRFAIFELEDGRRFRAQELARLMAAGKVVIPGFHHVRGDHLRADPDDAEANNLLRRFRSNPTSETVVANVRR